MNIGVFTVVEWGDYRSVIQSYDRVNIGVLFSPRMG